MARIPWLSLLLIAWLFTSAFGADECTSDGIIGTFGQDDNKGGREVTSLTITPVIFASKLEVSITKDASDDATDSDSVQVYLTLDENTECSGTISLSFTIAGDKEECNFGYDWNIVEKKIIPHGPTPIVAVDDNAVFQASFEVRKESGSYKMVFNDPSGSETKIQDAAGACFGGDGKKATFKFKVEKPATQDGKPESKECGVQYEMKGKYSPTEMKIGENKCKLVDLPGRANDDENVTPGSNETAAATTSSKTDDDTPMWVWIVVGVAVVIVVLVVIGLLLFFLVFKKKKNPEEDPEAEPQMPENPDDGVATADEIPDSEVAKEKGDESAAGEQAPGGEPSKNADQPEGSKKADQPEGSKKADDESKNDSAPGGD